LGRELSIASCQSGVGLHLRRTVSGYPSPSGVKLPLRREVSLCFSAERSSVAPCRSVSDYTSDAGCHITSSLLAWRLAFVRYQTISIGDDDYIVMISTDCRCRRLPHATPPFPGEDKASLCFVFRLGMMSVPPSVSSGPCPRRSHNKYKISAQLEMVMYSYRGALHGSPPSPQSQSG
jgi:hypothetical protein